MHRRLHDIWPAWFCRWARPRSVHSVTFAAHAKAYTATPPDGVAVEAALKCMAEDLADADLQEGRMAALVGSRLEDLRV